VVLATKLQGQFLQGVVMKIPITMDLQQTGLSNWGMVRAADLGGKGLIQNGPLKREFRLHHNVVKHVVKFKVAQPLI
jgi:hypothetical protein